MAKENFSSFTANMPKVQFYDPNKTRNHSEEKQKGERGEGREKKELAYPILLYRLLWREKKPKSVKIVQFSAATFLQIQLDMSY